MKKIQCLIVDDELELRTTIIELLTAQFSAEEFNFFEAADGRQALEIFEEQEFDLVFMDVRMPNMDGLTALKEMKERDPKIFVLIMTAHANLQDAVDAIKSGAYDYVEKPVQTEKLVGTVKKALETQSRVKSLRLSLPIMDDDIESDFVGDSKKMAEIFVLLNRLSQVDTTVLIRGENGTGKELVARAIHENSPRKHAGFVAINCGAIPDELIESELFGHERGAFTDATSRKIGKFQLANNGTLFLDEIAELKPELQVKLLRVLQERKFTPVGSNREIKTNARIVAATNQNLEKMIADGRFREDLFYRLNVMPIFLPPLRERTEDIEGLCEHFLVQNQKKYGGQSKTISPEVIDVLKRYNWPGNIRELENLIERALIIEKSDLLTLDSLPQNILDEAENRFNVDLKKNYSGPMDFDTFKEETEKEFIIQALKANRGKINQTVAQANIPKNTLLRKIRKYQINVKDFSD